MRCFLRAVTALICLSTSALGQSEDVVSYRLGLGGTHTPPPPCVFPACIIPIVTPYVHGSEAPNQVFDPTVTPEIRWDAVCEITGPNQGAANLVINVEIQRDVSGRPLMTQAEFLGDGVDGEPLNFSYSFAVTPNPAVVGRVMEPPVYGGPGMGGLSTTGRATPGRVEGAGSGYASWQGTSTQRPGVGRETMPDGSPSPALGLVPLVDGKIRIADLPNGFYFLVLIQGTGVNVLREGIDLRQAYPGTGPLVRRALNRPSSEIRFEVRRPTQSGGGSDNCPDDPNKSSPGVCGCGVSDIDSDQDGVPDCNDECPDDAAKTAPGACGCHQEDLDGDSDGTADCVDGCPQNPNKSAPDACGCGEGSASVDADADGTPDCVDGCPNDANKTAVGVCGCGVADTDTDGDGTSDCLDDGAGQGTPDDTDPDDSGPPAAPPCAIGAVEAAVAGFFVLGLVQCRRRR